MKLFTSANIGSLKIKNRVIMSPMNVGGNNDSDGCLSQRGIDYFVERAKGGIGMIVTGAVRVTREFERDSKTIPLWMLFADHMIHGKWISDLAEKCHDYNTKVCIQLTAGGGRIAGAYAQHHGLAISPSSTPCFYPPHFSTRPLSKQEIGSFVKSFEQAAKLIKRSGADAIQVHGHQGYLIDQFTTSLWNHRTDEYGGSLENRMRFSKEIIEAIKRGAGNDFPVIYRYGLTHGIEGGRTEEEGLEMAKLLEAYGVDALDIDSGCYETNYLPHPPSTIPCGSFANLAEKVKRKVNIPVISSTRIGYPEVAEKIISENMADFVSIGRPLIADPEWCNKSKAGNAEDIRPCLACHEGCLRRLMNYKRLSCAVNPAAGDENYLRIEPAETRKRIVVVGGGVAGMVASVVCSKRGHQVDLYERHSELGGNFQLEFLPAFKSDYQRYIRYLIRQLKKTKTEIHLGYQIEDVNKLSADIIIIATGADFRNLDIVGLTNDSIVPTLELYKNRSFDNKKYVIIGGGLVGVEAAINVAQHGGQPTIVEKYKDLAKTAYSVNRQHLQILLNHYRIPIFLNTDIINADGNNLVCVNQGKKIQIPYDKVAICAGMIPNRAFLEDSDRVITIGDADKVENVMNAVWTAYRKCRII